LGLGYSQGCASIGTGGNAFARGGGCGDVGHSNVPHGGLLTGRTIDMQLLFDICVQVMEIRENLDGSPSDEMVAQANKENGKKLHRVL
jgi:hypothetical protein